MKYVLLIYQGDFRPASVSREERAIIAGQYREVTTNPRVTPGPPLGLPENAVTVRVVDGETVAKQGPYVDAAGAVGGFIVFEAESEEEAVALAARIPAARLGGAIEVRPCEVYW